MGGNSHHHQGGGHCKQMIRVLAITFNLRDLLTLQFAGADLGKILTYFLN